MGEIGLDAARRPALAGPMIRRSVDDAVRACRLWFGRCVRRLGIGAIGRDAMVGGHTMATSPAAVLRIFFLACRAFDTRCGRYVSGGALGRRGELRVVSATSRPPQ